jgi:hypothetical protein
MVQAGRTGDPEPEEAHVNPTKIILGLIPFALFAVLAAWIPVGWAALAGAAVAVVAVLLELRGGVKALPVVGIVVLGAFAAIGFTGGAFAQTLLQFYGRGLATLALALYIFATLGFAPFTAQFAKQIVPREHWASERFVRVNRHLSAAWGVAVLVTACSHLLAGAVEAAHVSAPIIVLALNWGLPILAILWTLKYSKRVAGQDASPAVTAG